MYIGSYDEQIMLWREKELLELLKDGKINTSEVVKRASMSKATVLKYLEGLKGKGLITCEMIGPTKLWSLANGEGDKEKENAHFDQKKMGEYIHVDRKIFKLLEEFESVTGKRLEVLINRKGIQLRIQEEPTAH